MQSLRRANNLFLPRPNLRPTARLFSQTKAPANQPIVKPITFEQLDFPTAVFSSVGAVTVGSVIGISVAALIWK